MATPPEHNLLTDPIAELEGALKAHAFGIEPTSSVLVDSCYPRTAQEREAVKREASVKHETPAGVIGRARIVFLSNEGEATVVLDGRGYSIEHITSAAPKQTTFESMDAFLIACSPAYVVAMQTELMKRFEGGTDERRYHDEAEEAAWID